MGVVVLFVGVVVIVVFLFRAEYKLDVIVALLMSVVVVDWEGKYCWLCEKVELMNMAGMKLRVLAQYNVEV